MKLTGSRAPLVAFGALLLAAIAIRFWFMASYRPAFMGFPDSQTYVLTAGTNLWFDTLRPAGYPIFLRIVHFVNDNLSAVTLVQHAIGIATALLLYRTVLHSGGGRWPALLPVAVVGFGGEQVFLEHAVMSETLFTFLVVLALFLATRMLTRPSLAAAALAGLCLGAATTVRPVSLLLIAALPVCLVATAALRGHGRRLALASVAGALLVLGPYLFASADATGTLSLTRTAGWDLYGRTAPIADCTRFQPPAGTAALCETKPERLRGTFDDYLFEDPSPARRAFGVFPRGDAKLKQFALATIWNEPLDYLGVVAKEMVRYGSPTAFDTPPSHYFREGLFLALTQRDKEAAAQVDISRYYATNGFLRRNEGALLDYGTTLNMTGTPMALLFLLALIAPFRRRGLPRRAWAVLMACSFLLLLVPAAVAHTEPRYGVPAYGLLATAAAIGLSRRAPEEALSASLAKRRAAWARRLRALRPGGSDPAPEPARAAAP